MLKYHIRGTMKIPHMSYSLKGKFFVTLQTTLCV